MYDTERYEDHIGILDNLFDYREETSIIIYKLENYLFQRV